MATTSVHENCCWYPWSASAQGSVYHPNLMTFDFSGLGGVGWAQDRSPARVTRKSANETQNLFSYLATVNFLSAKPYNATFFASQDHTYNNYDFFNTVTADSTRYGGRVGWSAKSFNLNTDMGYRDLTTSGITGAPEVSGNLSQFQWPQPAPARQHHLHLQLRQLRQPA